ncbi:MAG: patatin-like phospholipase family protein [Ekhidna sp.]|uniref:patatin-like phospholipase family protein n=1 Tax=Ekhidna sp. TaxID=2608089 RepID=UPI0032EF2212
MTRLKQALNQILHSLMVQLTFHHFKKNLALLAVWIIIIAAFSGGLGKVYGIHYLFLDPEYLGKVSFWSFFIVGVAFGNLIMAWHITTYILDGHRFRFIGVLQRPFTKFSINNSFIPLLTLIAYIIFLILFQVDNGLAATSDILLFVVGLVAGIVAMHLLMILYFRFTNKDIFIFLAGSLDKRLRKSALSRDRVMKRLRENKADRYNVTNYLDLKLKVRSTEHIVHFKNKEAIVRVFDQNHFNSVVVELCIIGVILLLGFFMNIEFLQIPAAASALLIFAIAVMLVGAISYWFKGWGLTFALGIFILVNTGVKTGLGKGINEATGLNYDAVKTQYSIENLQAIHSKEQYIHDRLHMLETLENWKAKWKNPKDQKMVFLCVSGGGQRAALWAVNSLLNADSALNGTLMDQTFLITGASGGVIGAAYYREMARLNKQISLSGEGKQLLTNMGKDNLNPVIFGLLVNDLFFKIRTHDYAGRTYPIDRGYVFEQNLNKNLGYTLDKQLDDYRPLEESAEIPTLIMSPTIANDGRKLYISTQPISYMSTSSRVLEDKASKVRGVDFQALFKANEPEKLSFLSALRMSASFPYITPNISLPAEPRVEIMDAGISDNFGVSDAIRFINVFEDWITENTGGVVLLVVRDTKPNAPVEKRPNPSVIDRLTYPIASVYNNLTNMQDINNDLRLEQMRDWFDGEMDVVEIAYDSFERDKATTDVERASLSWHLTTKEKQHIIENINIESNKAAIKRLQDLLKNSSNP